MNKNQFKAYCKEKGVNLWEVAHEIGIADTTFSKKLRFPFEYSYESALISAVDRIAAAKSKNKNSQK